MTQPGFGQARRGSEAPALTPPADLDATLLASWRTNGRVTAYLVEHLPAPLWDTPVPGAPRRTIRMIAELTDCAPRYAAAWSSQNPASLAAFYAENGSLTVNAGAPSVGHARR